jgi:two-component system sensor histidine kinase/response regulator
MTESGKPYILLVDDTEANLRLLGPLLRAEGWSVAAATRGDQALQLIGRRVPDLLLLDIMMPEMDGFEVCRRLRATPATRDLPILFITALNDEENIVRGFNEGAQDYIAKPFRQAELIARIRTHLALRQATCRAEKQAVDLAKLNADKDRFFSIIAHDLRSPLAGLLGLSETLSANLAEFNPVEIGEATGQMAQAARNIYQLLENLLEWSQLQTGRMEFRPERLDLANMLNELAELFKPTAMQKQVALRLETKPAAAWADRRMMLTVFRNLISNALKFTSAGGVVTLRCSMGAEQATVEIKDNGIGIAPECLQNLFLSGSKMVSREGTGGEKGTGLGLVLCRELLDRSGGRVTAQSQPNRGSSFTVTLPKPS